MAFLLKEDYGASIRERYLDQVTEFDDNKLEQAGDAAVIFMKGFLNSRYDTEAIFTATGVDRDPILVMYGVDIALYNLHSMINPRKIPDLRMTRYERAEDWLTKVSRQLINPDLPLPEAPEQKDYIRFGGNTARNNYI